MKIAQQLEQKGIEKGLEKSLTQGGRGPTERKRTVRNKYLSEKSIDGQQYPINAR